MEITAFQFCFTTSSTANSIDKCRRKLFVARGSYTTTSKRIRNITEALGGSQSEGVGNFSDFSWSSTSGNIRSSVLFADWLLPRGFYAGAGIAANSLKHNGASDKALKPVFTFGKKKKFSSRLSINLGVIYQQVELSTSNITSNNTISSNTETGLAEALAAAGTTTETTTTSSNEAVAQVRSWLEQHPDRDKDNLIIVYSSTPLPISTVKYTTEVVPYRLVYAPGTSTTTTKTTTTNNATVIERTTETGTMQEIQTESKVTIPPLFFINISINF